MLCRVKVYVLCWAKVSLLGRIKASGGAAINGGCVLCRDEVSVLGEIQSKCVGSR